MKKDPYRWIAKQYDAIFQSMNTGLFRLGLKMYPPHKAMSVLDIGFGTGIQLAFYQKTGCEVWGIDSSPAMLEVAQKKLGSRANLHLGNATTMPFENNSFDLITTTLVLHEMEYAAQNDVLNEVIRVLKPNGRLLIIDFHPGTLKIPKGWFTKAFITLSEIAAGKEHFKNYQTYMKRGGLEEIYTLKRLRVKRSQVVSSGNMILMLLQKEVKFQ